MAASSFILDEVEEPLYDDGLFIHYTASIIEHMGGRGPGVVKAAREIYSQWAVNHHFEMYDDVAPTLRQLQSRGLIVGVISNSHRSLDAFRDHFELARADSRARVVVPARLHEAASQHFRDRAPASRASRPANR